MRGRWQGFDIWRHTDPSLGQRCIRNGQMAQNEYRQYTLQSSGSEEPSCEQTCCLRLTAYEQERQQLSPRRCYSYAGIHGLTPRENRNFIGTTIRQSNLHDLKVSDISSFSFSQKHCSYYTYVFNQDTENISLVKTFVSCMAWILTPCGHLWRTATIRNKQYESIHNPIYALC